MPSDDPLLIEREDGRSFGTRVLRLKGPVTLRNLFIFQSELRSGQPPLVTILDLTEVPYLDSAGMGAIINYYVHCQKSNLKLVVAGVSERVMELFRLTTVDQLITIAGSVEEAEAAL